MRCPCCGYDGTGKEMGQFYEQQVPFVRTKVFENIGYATVDEHLFTIAYGCPACFTIFTRKSSK